MALIDEASEFLKSVLATRGDTNEQLAVRAEAPIRSVDLQLSQTCTLTSTEELFRWAHWAPLSPWPRQPAPCRPIRHEDAPEACLERPRAHPDWQPSRVCLRCDNESTSLWFGTGEMRTVKLTFTPK